MESTKVPPDIWAKIIPSQNLSVSDLQNFPLPELAISKSPSQQPLQIFLSHLTPNITNVEEIIILQTPSEALLKTYSNALKSDSHGPLSVNTCMVILDFVYHFGPMDTGSKSFRSILSSFFGYQLKEVYNLYKRNNCSQKIKWT